MDVDAELQLVRAQCRAAQKILLDTPQGTPTPPALYLDGAWR